MSLIIHKSPEAARDRANAVDTALIPARLVKRAVLFAELQRATGLIQGIAHLEVDDLADGAIAMVEGGVYLPSRRVIRIPPGKTTIVTIVPPIQTSKAVLAYLVAGDAQALIEFSFDGGQTFTVSTVQGTDHFGRPVPACCGAGAVETAGDLVIKLTFDRKQAEAFDYLIGYGIGVL